MVPIYLAIDAWPGAPYFMKCSVLLLLVMLAGCTSQPTVTSWLDPVSVATITAQSEPLVLMAQTSSARRVLSRTYAALTAIEVNRMGTRRLYLAVIPRIPGEISPQQQATLESSFDEVEIRIEDRPIVLTRHTGSVAELGIGEPALLPVYGSTPIYFAVERTTLSAMAESNRLELAALGLSGKPQLYQGRTDGLRSLGEFVSQLPDATL